MDKSNLAEQPSDVSQLTKPDVRAIMARIREEVRLSTVPSVKEAHPYRPAPSSWEQNDVSAKGLPSLESLRFMNANWQNWQTAVEPVSHRPIIGTIVVRIKKFIIEVVHRYILSMYFDRERDFHYHLLQFLNHTARHIDSRDYELYWQLVKKIDNEIVGLNERMDCLFDEGAANLATVEYELKSRLATLESLSGALKDSMKSTHSESQSK